VMIKADAAAAARAELPLECRSLEQRQQVVGKHRQARNPCRRKERDQGSGAGKETLCFCHLFFCRRL
jgi:hypothetical protein